jgi:hypothetical protein
MKRFLSFLMLMALLISLCGCEIYLKFPEPTYGFAREVPEEEQNLRMLVVQTAQSWLGCNEEDGSFKPIIDLYNSHKPLAVGYLVQYTDQWCAAFGSAVAIQCELTEIIPTECGCERQIGLWQKLERWEENDNYMPLPGDYIYYNWDARKIVAENTGWSDHVGIVVGTSGPFIKVIEGNKDDMVAYRIILRGDYRIRGYGLPNYAAKLA